MRLRLRLELQACGALRPWRGKATAARRRRQLMRAWLCRELQKNFKKEELRDTLPLVKTLFTRDTARFGDRPAGACNPAATYVLIWASKGCTSFGCACATDNNENLLPTPTYLLFARWIQCLGARSSKRSEGMAVGLANQKLLATRTV